MTTEKTSTMPGASAPESPSAPSESQSSGDRTVPAAPRPDEKRQEADSGPTPDAPQQGPTGGMDSPETQRSSDASVDEESNRRADESQSSDAPSGDAASATGPTEQADQNVAAGDASSENPAEKTRRRVQLRPTYSPESARPIPSIAAQSAAEEPAQTEPAAPTEAPSQAPQSAPEADRESADQAVTETRSESPTRDDASLAVADAPALHEDDASTATTTAEDADHGATSSGPPPPAEPVELPPKDQQLDADIEAELDAALSGDTGDVQGADEALSTAAEAGPAPRDQEVKRGAKLTGTVQSIHGDDMFIDLGVRMAGVLSRRQFGLRKQPMQGESITIIVGRIDEKEGLVHVNLPTGTSRVRGNWDEISVDQAVECQVNQTNKGGLEVTVGGLRGFMPASQVELGYVADLNAYVGQKLRAQVTEVNPKRRKLVLSRRKLLEAEREQTEQEFFQTLAAGQTYQGRVKTIKDYGAFVDIGGVDGLLHVGQISWSRINHPKDVLSEGQEVEVKVLSVDPEKKKIGLGMRQMSQNPWKTAEVKYPSGTVVKGKVTRIENFGGFVELEPGVEGLVHISELDHQRIKSVNEVLRVGQEVEVQVLEVNPSRKRVSLSVKALREKPEEAPAPQESAAVSRPRPESLKGGIGEPTGGQLFGDPRQFGR